jgi:two-component system, NarL family, nitrate/nitrite response regulator NarL
MTDTIRLLIIDDTCLYRDGLAAILGREAWVSAAWTAADEQGALRHLNGLQPDVVLLNMATVDSVGILDAVMRTTPVTRVIALGVSENEDEVIACAEAGVAGYLLRRQSLADLVEVVQSVARGETLCTPRMAATLLRRIATLAAERRWPAEPARLTSREREILDLVDQGLSNKEIARRLCIEIRTVKNHVHNILDKLNVHRRGEAAALMRAARAARHRELPVPSGGGY